MKGGGFELMALFLVQPLAGGEDGGSRGGAEYFLALGVNHDHPDFAHHTVPGTSQYHRDDPYVRIRK